MTDIVKWLREANPCGRSYQLDAADEIERLRAELAEARISDLERELKNHIHLDNHNAIVRQKDQRIEILDAENDALAQRLEAFGTELDKARRDARRYRLLRRQRWDSSALCVVVNPKQNLKLGAYCPSLELLDVEVDAELVKDPE